MAFDLKDDDKGGGEEKPSAEDKPLEEKPGDDPKAEHGEGEAEDIDDWQDGADFSDDSGGEDGEDWQDGSDFDSAEMDGGAGEGAEGEGALGEGGVPGEETQHPIRGQVDGSGKDGTKVSMKVDPHDDGDGHMVHFHDEVSADLRGDSDYQHHATEWSKHTAGYHVSKDDDPERSEAHRHAANLHARIGNALHAGADTKRERGGGMPMPPGMEGALPGAPGEEEGFGSEPWNNGEEVAFPGEEEPSPGDDALGNEIPSKPDMIRNEPPVDTSMGARKPPPNGGAKPGNGDKPPFGKSMRKAGGPYIGPRGGKYADAKRTIPWTEGKKDKFRHHRLLAGYHETKAKEAGDRAYDWGTSSDPELRKEAKKFEAEESHHWGESAKHGKKAEAHYSREKHGPWGDTMVEHDEAESYGAVHYRAHHAAEEKASRKKYRSATTPAERKKHATAAKDHNEKWEHHDRMATRMGKSQQSDLRKGGPYIGPRGGKWEDPQHTIPWKPHGTKAHAAYDVIHKFVKTKRGKEPTEKQITDARNLIVRGADLDVLKFAHNFAGRDAYSDSAKWMDIEDKFWRVYRDEKMELEWRAQFKPGLGSNSLSQKERNVLKRHSPERYLYTKMGKSHQSHMLRVK